MSYKRLTETLSRYINGNPCKPYGHCLANCMEQKSISNNEKLADSCGDCEHFGKILTRLAELEDKIENGTLIELPCKVGDKVYRICGTPKRRFIKEKICWGICFNNFGIEIHTDGAVDIISDNIFLTKAEAEAKLKELQKNGKQ